MERKQEALENFMSGRNCAQSVFMAYADLLNLSAEQAAMVSAGFGGGMGRLRKTCGAFSACVALCGYLIGEDGGDPAMRPQVYAKVQESYRRFIDRCGSVDCAVLLKKPPIPESPFPDERTAEYYAKRPCIQIVGNACDILDELLAEKEAADA